MPIGCFTSPIECLNSTSEYPNGPIKSPKPELKLMKTQHYKMAAPVALKKQA